MTHARHYAQIWDEADNTDQTSDDLLVFPSAPPEVRGGVFDIYYIPGQDSDVVSPAAVLLSIDLTATIWQARLFDGAGAHLFLEVLNPGLLITSNPTEIEFDAGDELKFRFDAINGKVTVSGAKAGNGDFTGTGWSLADGPLTLGSHPGATNQANGYISLPYAVLGAPVPVLP